MSSSSCVWIDNSRDVLESEASESDLRPIPCSKSFSTLWSGAVISVGRNFFELPGTMERINAAPLFERNFRKDLLNSGRIPGAEAAMMVAATSSWAQRAGGTAVRVKSGSDETFGMLAKRMIEAMQAEAQAE